MALLILFGFLAGAATALSPCVLPVLPIALSAGATGGHRRPLGIVAGLAISFTFATVALVYVISALGLPDDLLRNLAIVVLLGFGITLMIPPLAARLEAWMSQFAGRFGGPRTGGEGFWSGVAVGLSLGFVYAPCAGPILAGVITVSASQSFSAGRLAVALAYGIGSAVVLYFLMLGGRKAIAPLARRGVGLQIAMGAVMVLVAVAMLRDYDIRFQNRIASDLPAFLVNPSEALEDTASAQDALADLRDSGHGVGSEASGEAPETTAAGKLDLPVLGKAPEFVGNQRWFNTPGGKPLTLDKLRGRVVLVDFWTYSCINCIRTFPYLKAWDERYRKDGLTIVGVHSPEFPFEKEAGNVERAIDENEIRYPVAQDNDLATWYAYANQYWPAEYFIDAEGNVRYAHFGEGEYEEKEEVIRELLAEAGHDVGSSKAGGHGISAAAGVTTPETYLGAARAEGFTNGEISPGSHDFTAPEALPDNALAYHGRWRVSLDSATAEGGSLDLNFGARRVYLVLGSPGRERRVRVMLDGKPIAADVAGTDVENGALTVSDQRLYNLVDLPAVGDHVLELQPEAGVEGYAFTFG
ncbi:MAG TPA: cytochrome c biogenesis protein DipZ [Solirubrobacterales bacterium]|nr:cytochrome c biogenesis protein DipZ [Solirubrobacterales bacterium]